MKFLPRLLLPMLAFACTATAAEPPSMAAQSRTVPPRLHDRQPNLGDYYPEPRDREALVYLRFNLTADGKIIDLEQAEGGFHEPRFVAAALNVTRKLRFHPATLDGKPVEFQGASIPIRFSLPGPDGGQIQGVTPQFRAEAKKVQTLIENKDVAGAHFHAQWMMSEKVRLGFEYAVLQSTLAYTHARAGNTHRALAASREVTAHAGMNAPVYQPGESLPKLTLRDFLLTKELLAQMLQLRINLDTSQGFYVDALRAHADLQALGLVPAGDPSLGAFQRMLAALQVANTLRGHARIDEAGYWTHELWFRNFTVATVKGGSLRNIGLSCAGYSSNLPYVPDVDWNVPARWQNCSVRIEGTSGTEFDIVEFRDAPKAETALPPAAAGTPAATN